MSAGKLGSETMAACSSSATSLASVLRRADCSLSPATKLLRSSASSRRPWLISMPISLAALFWVASVLSSSTWMALRRSSSFSILAMTGAASTPFLASLRMAAWGSSLSCLIVSMVSSFCCVFPFQSAKLVKIASKWRSGPRFLDGRAYFSQGGAAGLPRRGSLAEADGPCGRFPRSCRASVVRA